MKAIAAVLIIFLAIHTSEAMTVGTVPAKNPDDIFTFLKAYWQSAFNLTMDVEQCVNGTETIWKIVPTAVQMWKDGNQMGAVLYFMNSFPEMYDGVTQCGFMVPSLLHGVQALKVLKNPAHAWQSIMKAVALHVVAIPTDISQVILAIQKRDW